MSEIIREKIGNKIFALLNEEKAPPYDVILVLQNILLIIIDNNASTRDLQEARQLYDNFKSQALSYLSRKGWE